LATNAQKRILIAPLDWGLGHTTRCVPLISWLRENDCTPVFAGNSWQRSFIEETFAGIETIHLDGYNVRYSRHRFSFLPALFMQLPRLVKTTKAEQDWLNSKLPQLRIDGIISDNRYGLFHRRVPSVFMTHQLQVKTGLGKTADRIVRNMHYHFIRRFGDCWVPDSGAVHNLSGTLGHPSKLPPRTRYLGLLSQFAGATADTGKHVLVLLSGPEPQRSILSSLLWKVFIEYDSPVVFVEGSTDAPTPPFIPGQVSYHKRLTKTQLLPLLQDASIVYCRSGYSTLMDLVALGKKAVIIPTPGQTEQEYLAEHLHRQGFFFHLPQHAISKTALQQPAAFPFYPFPVSSSFRQFEAVLRQWINTL